MITKKFKIQNSIARMLLVMVGAITLVAVFSMLPNEKKNQNEVVATVEGESITSTEIRHWMLLNKTNVYNEFYRSHDATYGDDFWTKEFEGETPLEMLKRRSLEDAVRYKMQQQLAKQSGIHTFMDFDELMRDRERINQERKQKVEDGKSVYGPVNLTPRNYVKKVQDEMVQSIKDVLTATEFKIDDKKMRSLYIEYKAKRNTTGRNKDKVPTYEDFSAIRQMEFTKEKYYQLIEEMSRTAAIEIVKPVYKRIGL